ncbi:pseudouridine synthase, partial [Methylobacterium oxalidis]
MNATPPDDSPDADPPETDAPGSRPDAGPAWAPATDAGVPGDDAEARPPRKGGRKPAAEPRKAKPLAKAKPVKERPPSGASADAAAGTGEAGTADPAPEPEGTPEGERIAKAIARAGIASRRDAEAMIAEGRVTLNGAVLDSPAVNVTEADRITVDGEPLPARERTRLWLFHKPRGLVTTARDPEGRQTVFETLPEDLPRVVAVGRLDINTEGLLLLTNDGGLAKVIAHPDTGWLRRYRVRAHGDTTQAELDRLRKGVTIDGMEYGAIEASLDRVQGDNLWLTLGLREGKNRE